MMFRKMFCSGCVALALLLAAQSCNVQRDCKGRVKHRLPNGVWI